MPLPRNHSRFHFDPSREQGEVPTVAQLERWCVDQLTGPHGEDTREAVAQAGRSAAQARGAQEAVRDVALAAADAMRRAAREIHEIATEFGYDPTRHADTTDACVRLCLARVTSTAGSISGASGRAAALDEMTTRLMRAVRLTSEAQAITALTHSMIERGRCDYRLLAAARDDLSPETAEMLDVMWGRAPGDWSLW